MKRAVQEPLLYGGSAAFAGVTAAGVFAGAALLPLTFLIMSAHAQPEVAVVERAGTHLLEHGTPYLSPSELAGRADYEAYNPYLPGMALLGLGLDALAVGASLLYGRPQPPVPPPCV